MDRIAKTFLISVIYLFLYLVVYTIFWCFHSALYGIFIIVFLLLCHISWFVISWKEHDRCRPYFVIINTICLFIVGFLIHHLIADKLLDYFTPVRWASNQGSRLYMVDDLVTTYKFEGMNKEQITRLLGHSKRLQNGKNFKGTVWDESKTDLNVEYYDIGRYRGLMSKYSRLYLFYRNDQVVKYEIDIQPNGMSKDYNYEPEEK